VFIQNVNYTIHLPFFLTSTPFSIIPGVPPVGIRPPGHLCQPVGGSIVSHTASRTASLKFRCGVMSASQWRRSVVSGSSFFPWGKMAWRSFPIHKAARGSFTRCRWGAEPDGQPGVQIMHSCRRRWCPVAVVHVRIASTLTSGGCHVYYRL